MLGRIWDHAVYWAMEFIHVFSSARSEAYGLGKYVPAIAFVIVAAPVLWLVHCY